MIDFDTTAYRIATQYRKWIEVGASPEEDAEHITISVICASDDDHEVLRCAGLHIDDVAMLVAALYRARDVLQSNRRSTPLLGIARGLGKVDG